MRKDYMLNIKRTFQFAIFLLNLGTQAMKFLNTVELYDKVLPFEWNSFCISMSKEKVVIYHNGQVQGMQNMTIKDAGRHLKTLTMGHIGGAKFIGIISDLQIHSRELSGEELSKWTKCRNEVRIINTLSLT